MRLDSARWFLPLALAIAAIMLATMVLGYYSYEATKRLAARSEESIEKSNSLVGQKVIDRIEKVIIDSDRMLFRLVILDNPREFTELWKRIVAVSGVVEAVAVLDENRTLLHLVGNMPPSQMNAFRQTFITEMVPAMELGTLPLDAHRHLHRYFGSLLTLLSFIHLEHDGQRFYIVLSTNLQHIKDDIFREEFRGLEESRYLAVLDEDGPLVYGSPAPDRGSFVFEQRFPTTLYRWRLQIAPKDIGTIRREARARRTINTLLVGAAYGLIFIGMLTLLLAIRKERRANQLKSDFISNVTHELKTPLSLIRMFGELLTLGRPGTAQTAREYAEIITRESDRLSRLIDNVLDFARIERGMAAYEFKLGDLRTVVERSVDLVRHRAEQAGVQLDTRIEPELPEVPIDENAMTLLLHNLLENALKYGVTEKPRGSIHVSLAREDSRLVLRVSDDGPGIPRDELSRIFERFYRGRAARRTSIRGSGIGLSLVKHIAQAHGGEVQVDSELGRGTTFAVWIPLRSRTRGEDRRMT